MNVARIIDEALAEWSSEEHIKVSAGEWVAHRLGNAGIDLYHIYEIDGVGVSRGIPLYHRRALVGS